MLTQFNINTPYPSDPFKDIYTRIRDIKERFKERWELSHYFGESTDTTNPKCDGIHKMVNLPYIDNVESKAGAGVLYVSKNVYNRIDLCFKNSEGDYHLTHNGSLPDELFPTIVSGITTSHILCIITISDGRFLAGGAGGLILRSNDAVTWTTHSTGSTQYVQGLAYNGSNLYVAVGTNGYIGTSTDTINWTTRTTGTTQSFNAIIYANGLFVAVTSSCAIFTSPDGITWTSRLSVGIDRNEFHDVAYGNGLFVAVGNPMTLDIYTSPDGITWTKRSCANSGTLRGITFGNGKFVTVGDSGYVFTSTDGIIWERKGGRHLSSLMGICYHDPVFVACGMNGSILIIDKDLNFVSRTSKTTNLLRSITYGGYGTIAFVIVGDSGTIIKGQVG